MISPENRLFCRLDHRPDSQREQRRLQLLQEFGLLKLESVPIFEEATQTAARFLDAPICILSVLDRDRQWFKSAVGLSRIGLMNALASSRQLPRQESFCSHVVDSEQVLVVPDTLAHPVFAHSLLTQQYGLRSYLGVPLLTSSGDCLGSLAILGLSPRAFTNRDIEFLQLTARWSMSEFERNCLLAPQSSQMQAAPSPSAYSPAEVTVNLIAQMTQELCTPLTSILGMARVLEQGIYGSLSGKQKEYIQIIHNSGQYLLSLVNEIVDLGALDQRHPYLNLSSVDIEMLCQQAIATLNQAAQRRNQQIHLTVEPGSRIWLLDKDKVRQMLYHLTFSVIQASTSESTIQIHVSRKEQFLNMTIWPSHPWLDEGLPQIELASGSMLAPYAAVAEWSRPDNGLASALANLSAPEMRAWNGAAPNFLDTMESRPAEPPTETEPALDRVPPSPARVQPDGSRQSLGLLFSRQLAELHQGCVMIRGSVEEGYRYIIRLPQLKGGAV